MKPERLKRYQDKINYIFENLKDISLQPRNDLEKKGIFYSIQTSIESMIDLIAMGVKDLGIQVQDDSTNISNMVEKLQLNPNMGKKLNEVNGLRNILVHRHNGVDEEIIMKSVPDIQDLLYKWIGIIEGVMKDNSQD